MIAPACTHSKLTKHGKDRHGKQRWKCARCGATVTRDEYRRPLGDMRLDPDKAAVVLNLLLEGMSIRAAARITGVDKNTICDLVLTVGERCDEFLARTVRNVPARFVELDEIWSFIFAKAKTLQAKNNQNPEIGDSWTWIGIDAGSKLILSHTVGKRDEATCCVFLRRLANAIEGKCQITSDNLGVYKHNVPLFIGSRCDFAQLTKIFATAPVENRYSPPRIIGTEKAVRFGSPKEEHISTSYVERFNLSIRMHARRWTRLTNAHSKTLEHHTAMMALFVAWYNFCRPNMALGKNRTPAMAAGLAQGVWGIADLLGMAAS